MRCAYEVDTDQSNSAVTLVHTDADGERTVKYRIQLTTTRPNFGGLRWWFLCPLTRNGNQCGRRVAKLYYRNEPNCFACRRCHNLTYRSCQESRLNDLFGRLAQDSGIRRGEFIRRLHSELRL